MKRKRLFRILLILWTLCLLVFICLLIVNQWVLPQKVRPLLLQQVREKTGLLPEAGSFAYHPVRGFVLSDIRLYDPEQREAPLLQAKAFSFRFPWIALLFKRQLILSDLSLQEPRFTLRRDAEGRWDVEKYFEKKVEGPGAPLISHFSLTDGTLEIVDGTLDPPYQVTLTPLRLNASFSLPDQIRFKGRFGVSGFPTEVAIEGSYGLSQQELSFSVELQKITTSLLQPYLAALPFTLTDTKGDLRCQISLDRNQTLSFQKIHYEGHLGLRQETWQMAGEAVLDGFYTLWSKDPPEMDYFFTLLLREGSVAGGKLPSAIQPLEGKLVVKKEGLTVETLKGMWAGQSFVANGSLQNFQEPLLDCQIQAALDLPSLQTLSWAEPLMKYGKILAGKGALQLTFRGPLGKEIPIDYLAEGRLEGISFKADMLPDPIEGVGGTFTLRPGQLLLQDIEGLYQKDLFQLKASVNDFKQPQIALNFSQKGQDLEARFTLMGEDLQPLQVSLRRGPASVSFEGALTHYQDPFLDGTIRLEGPLQDLVLFLPQVKPQMEKLELRGDLNGQFLVKGPLKRPNDLLLHGTVTLPQLSIREISLKEVQARLRYAEQVLSLSDLICQVYGGSFTGKLSWGFSEPSPFMIQMEGQGIRLERFLPRLSQKLRKAEGILDWRLRLEGDSSDQQSIVGEGAFAIREGNLYQVPILKGLFGAWGPMIGVLYPQLDEWVILKEAMGEFLIANRAIRTETLRVIGDRLTLFASGQVGFDQSLDFDVGLRFTDPAILERSSELSRLKNILIDETGVLSGAVKVKGTLSEPKFRYSSRPLGRIKNLFKGAVDLLAPGIFGEE